MSVNAVTARSHGGFVSPNQTATIHRLGRGPVSQRVRILRRTAAQRLRRAKRVKKLPPRILRPKAFPTRVPTAIQRKVAKRAILKLALKVLGKKVLGLPGEVVVEALQQSYKRVIKPEGFPGWGNFTASWTSDPGTPYPGAVPGDYTINGFDTGPYGTSAKNLIDINDGDIFGRRYWGHYENSNPLPNGRPADDWATEFDLFKETPVRPRVEYRKLRDLAPLPALARWTPRSGFSVSMNTKTGNVGIRIDPKRIRDRDPKVKPKSQFIYAVLRGLANSGGEFKEWVDIFADASMYIKGSLLLPEHLRNTGKETQAKIYWLFFIDGVNGIDFDHLARLVRENVVEDLAYGALGQLSKYAAVHLNLTVGPQTGLVM